MSNRDIMLIILVLLGISWLIFENYHRKAVPTTKPQTTQEKPAAAPTAK